MEIVEVVVVENVFVVVEIGVGVESVIVVVFVCGWEFCMF